MAAYGMRDWTKAVDHFQTIHNEYPTNKEAEHQLSRSLARLKESQTGKYDFKTICTKLHERECKFDVADYTGPIFIGEVAGKGNFSLMLL